MNVKQSDKATIPRAKTQGRTGGVEPKPTAKTDYLKELAKIAPRWAKLIGKKGAVEVLEGDYESILVNGRRLNIVDHARCVVGEAWGFSSAYLTNESKYCNTCTGFAIAFCRAKGLELTTRRFIAHFKLEHGEQ